MFVDCSWSWLVECEGRPQSLGQESCFSSLCAPQTPTPTPRRYAPLPPRRLIPQSLGAVAQSIVHLEQVLETALLGATADTGHAVKAAFPFPSVSRRLGAEVSLLCSFNLGIS